MTNKIELNVCLIGLNGQPLKYREDDAAVYRPMILRDACVEALVAPDGRATPVERLARGLLAERLYLASEAALTVEEIAKLKTLIGERFAPLVVLAAYRLLDPASVPTAGAAEA